MIGGIVNDDMEATIQLAVRDSKGRLHPTKAVIDTGFNGFLTLPASMIAKLDLPWLCRQEGMLADGSVQVFDVYTADVEWNGQFQTVEAESAEGVPLVGMRLLLGNQLEIQVKVGGPVTVEVMS